MKNLKKLIESAKRKIRKNNICVPPDGMITLIIYFNNHKNKKYGYNLIQIEYVNDSRLNKDPYIVVWAWRPNTLDPISLKQEYVPGKILRRNYFK